MSVVTVGSGTVVGQLASVALSPLLTRMYDPVAFGMFGIFTSIIGPISAVCCLKFDSAIVLEREDCDAVDVAKLSLTCASAISVITAALIFGTYVVGHMAWSPIVATSMIICAPLSIMIAAGTYVGAGFSARYEDYRALSRYQYFRSIGSIIFQASLGAISGLGVFLILGQIGGQLAGIRCLRQNLRELFTHPINLRLASLWHVAKRHRSFALYGAPQAVINTFSTSIPMLLLAGLFGQKEVGLFWLAFRMLMLPSQIIAESIRAVLYKRLTSLLHQGSPIVKTYIAATLGLVAISAPIALIIVIAAPSVFHFAFGEAWVEAGSYAQLLAPSWLISIAAVPAAVIVSVTGKQRVFLIYEVISLAAKVAALLIGSKTGNSFISIGLFSASSGICQLFWIVFMWLNLKRAKG
jgi:O-antigen/teichoic acid export membrane protein